MLGRADERPGAPLNLLADMGGGGLMLAFGMTCALLEARRARVRARSSTRRWSRVRRCWRPPFTRRRRWAGGTPSAAANLLDSGAHFYDVYETSDGRYMAVGAIEPHSTHLLLEGLRARRRRSCPRRSTVRLAGHEARFAEVFRTRTRDEWTRVFADSDACVSPVGLTPEEASAGHTRSSAVPFIVRSTCCTPARRRVFRARPRAPIDPPPQAGTALGRTAARVCF